MKLNHLILCCSSLILPSCAAVSTLSTFDEGLALYENKDYQGAYNAFRACAKNGELSCINNIGIMYENGHVTSRVNMHKAVSWYNLAANSGNTSAINNLTRLGYPIPESINAIDLKRKVGLLMNNSPHSQTHKQ